MEKKKKHSKILSQYTERACRDQGHSGIINNSWQAFVAKMERSQTTFGLVYIKNLILTSTLSYLQILEHFPQTIVCAHRHENTNSAHHL